jgi:hypothetical protein
MSAFFDALDAAMTDRSEIVCRRLLEFDFDMGPLRLWEGNGKLITSDGKEWIGFYHGDQSFLSVPVLSDGRDGSSPLLSFELGFLDDATYSALKDVPTRVKGRALNIWRVYMETSEGLRPVTPPGYPVRLTMVSTSFTDHLDQDEVGYVRRKSCGVTARPVDENRTYAPNGSVTDADQNRRSARLGVVPDRYARFVPLQQNKTHTIF